MEMVAVIVGVKVVGVIVVIVAVIVGVEVVIVIVVTVAL